MSHLLLLLPFAALIVLNLLPKAARPAASWTAVGIVLAFQTVAAILQPFHLVDWSFLAPFERAVGFSLNLDSLAILLILTAGIAGLASVVVAGAGNALPRTKYTFVNLILIA
ncbi:MAG TPA: hypothetical protein VMF68_11550, partial [Spirochaetia bacterium]|nr:hypothetical protein [Spirochaetia bacterium]